MSSHNSDLDSLLEVFGNIPIGTIQEESDDEKTTEDIDAVKKEMFHLLALRDPSVIDLIHRNFDADSHEVTELLPSIVNVIGMAVTDQESCIKILRKVVEQRSHTIGLSGTENIIKIIDAEESGVEYPTYLAIFLETSILKLMMAGNYQDATILRSAREYLLEGVDMENAGGEWSDEEDGFGDILGESDED